MFCSKAMCDIEEWLSLRLAWSGKRDSNSRPQPWQGCALPTELFPQNVLHYPFGGFASAKINQKFLLRNFLSQKNHSFCQIVLLGDACMLIINMLCHSNKMRSRRIWLYIR